MTYGISCLYTTPQSLLYLTYIKILHIVHFLIVIYESDVESY